MPAYFGMLCIMAILFLVMVIVGDKSQSQRHNSISGINVGTMHINGREIRPGNPEYAAITEQLKAIETTERRNRAEAQAAARKTQTAEARRALSDEDSPALSPDPEVRQLAGANFTAATLSQDGTILAGITSDGKTALWNTQTGQLQRLLYAPRNAKTNTTDIRHTPGQNSMEQTSVAASPYFQIALAPNNNTVACLSRSGIKLWDTPTKKFRDTLNHKNGHPSTVAFSGDSRFLISGGEALHEVWDLKHRKLITPPNAERHYLDALAVAYSPDGRYYMRADIMGIISVWDAHTHKLKWRKTETDFTKTGMSFSPDGRYLAAAGKSSAICWNTLNGSRKDLLSARGGFTAVAFSPDSQWIAYLQKSWEQWTVKLCHLPTSKIATLVWPQPLAPSTGEFAQDGLKLRDIKFSQDGTRLQCVLSDGTLAVWRFKKPLKKPPAPATTKI